MRRLILSVAIAVVTMAGFVGDRVNTSAPGWLSISQAEARGYHGGARRTARRTAHRHSGYGYSGAAVAGAAVVTAIAVGTIVSSLPPSCSTVVVDGVTYHNCSGTYYAPRGSQWVVVETP